MSKSAPLLHSLYFALELRGLKTQQSSATNLLPSIVGDRSGSALRVRKLQEPMTSKKIEITSEHAVAQSPRASLQDRAYLSHEPMRVKYLGSRTFRLSLICRISMGSPPTIYSCICRS